jgi:hypothetical protein
MKKKKPINQQQKRGNHPLCHSESAQMITLMGVLLAISVFVIAAIPSELSDLDTIVPSERFRSILPEFAQIKDAFGVTLNYNLVDVTLNEYGDSSFSGDIKTIESVVDQTKKSFQTMMMNHDMFFDAIFQKYWYSHTSDNGNIYLVQVSLSLDDGSMSLSEEVTYSIICDY